MPSNKLTQQNDLPESELCSPGPISTDKAAPATLNWNTLGFVSPVKDQSKHCVTCFIFGPVGAAESAWYRFKGKRDPAVEFSEQAILNCMYEGVKDTVDDPCFINKTILGGLPIWTFDFMVKNGLVLKKDEPYVAKTGHCKADYPVFAKPLTYCTFKNANDEILKRQLFRNGPLSVTINSNGLNDLCPGQPYKGPCDKKKYHIVLLVGYDEEFWYFKNSWAADWNGDGYFKMPRDPKVCQDCSLYAAGGFVPLFKL